jgi:ATP adenylyltransferase
MTYVGGAARAECAFCDALAHDDDAGTLIVHRGEHAFVILNLYPYNTGHLMVVPNAHVDDLAMLSTAARAEVAELTASFCTGLRLVTGCAGLNVGMNLGSAAGAGIADHLHQHIVPRWTGDANFLPIVGGTKVLPELVPATYAKIRAEVARQKSSAGSVVLVALDQARSHLLLEGEKLPRIPLTDGTPAWRSAMMALTEYAATSEIAGWGGAASTMQDTHDAPVLALSLMPLDDAAGGTCRWHAVNEAPTRLPDPDRTISERARQRFG